MKRFAGALVMAVLFAGSAQADDPLLEEAVAFTGQMYHLQSGVPGLLIGAVRNGERAVAGFGETKPGSGLEPDGDTLIGVASITKTFTGLVLANLVAEGTLKLTDPAGPHVGIVDALPERDGQKIRFVDLATHSSGLGRELESFEGVERYSDESFQKNLVGDPLMYAPSDGVLYSNIGFDVLGMALSGAAGKPFADLMQEKVLGPLNLKDSGYGLAQPENAFTGVDWNGNEMPWGKTIPNRFGASQLRTTTNDMLTYLEWNLDRYSEEGAEARLLSHAAYVIRDGLAPVFGLDESGHMDAMGLGWVIMMPEGNRPLIIQKAGGTDGMLSYLAFAPTRGIGVFISINAFDFAAGMEMAEVINDLIATLTPR